MLFVDYVLVIWAVVYTLLNCEIDIIETFLCAENWTVSVAIIFLKIDKAKLKVTMDLCNQRTWWVLKNIGIYIKNNEKP